MTHPVSRREEPCPCLRTGTPALEKNAVARFVRDPLAWPHTAAASVA